MHKHVFLHILFGRNTFFRTRYIILFMHFYSRSKFKFNNKEISSYSNSAYYRIYVLGFFKHKNRMTELNKLTKVHSVKLLAVHVFLFRNNTYLYTVMRIFMATFHFPIHF